MSELKIEKIVLKNLERGENLYSTGFSLTKWGMERNQFEIVEIGMQMMEKGLQYENSSKNPEMYQPH